MDQHQPAEDFFNKRRW